MLVTLIVSALLSASSPCLLPPVQAVVSDPFRTPECPYCAGNRGLEYAPADATPVVAGAAGSVTFAGSVAGVKYVVVELAGGYRLTYGRLATIAVARGQAVVAGQVVATTTRRLFFGVRLGEDYLDPSAFLATALLRPHLVPLDGGRRRPGPPVRLSCR
jgi:murein DD-endopeptidase MepM/ murein hydrolase activator NlpD